MGDHHAKMERAASPLMDPALTDAGLQPADSAARADDNDPRASLRHVLAGAADDAGLDGSVPGAHLDWTSSTLPHPGAAALRSDVDPDSEDNPHASVITTTTRRNANGSVSSVFSGNRITCLKKEDGQPFWRKDIQFLFLRYVFEDESKVFTKASEGTTGHTFAEIYIDAMAKSSKCSQILKEKLLTDKSSAIDMAMICLLVNVGRMNTTLNFFPEMRARVRTYHAIPCLQAQQGSNAYKQLQDGPRLKSILKGAMEDTQQPSNIDELLSAQKPRTNPVNLIFVLSQYAPRVSETHFFPPRDFFDLFMRTNISSKSRATAFLWLMWWYLESDFSIDASQQNPFGPGIAGSENEAPIKLPPLEIISDEQADAENMDTEEEIQYGEAKRQERESIVANDIPPVSGTKKGQKNPISEQQHNYRFRYSPYGSSASDSGGSRGRGSPSPSREMKSEQHPHSAQQRRHRRYGGDRTWSHSPRTATPRRGNPRAPNKLDALLNEDSSSSSYMHGQRPGATSSAASRRAGVGSGGRSRRSRENRADLSPRPLLFSGQSATAEAGLRDGDIAESSSRHIASNAGAPNMSPDLGNRNAAGGAGGATRTRARPQLTVEQSRRERITYTLYQRMQELRKYKNQERRRRGALVDAWIKCKVLPGDYDSEEDEPGRWAGVDAITALRTAEANAERRDEPIDAGDAGAATKKLAKGFNRLAHVLDGVKVTRSRGRLGPRAERVVAGQTTSQQQGTEAVHTKALSAMAAPPVEPGSGPVRRRGGRRAGPRGKAGMDSASVVGDDAMSASGSMRKRKRAATSSRRGGDSGFGAEPGGRGGYGKKRQRLSSGGQAEQVSDDDEGSGEDDLGDDVEMGEADGGGASATAAKSEALY